MKISYNYEDLLAEIESDIKEGLLDPAGNILVLRENIVGYNAIVDYYYPDMTYDEELFDDETDKFYKKRIRDEYEKVKDRLENITVKACLAEMREMNRVL